MKHWKSPTWHNLSWITTSITINADYPASDGSTTEQLGPLTSVTPNSIIPFPCIWRSKVKLSLWQMYVLTQVFHILGNFLLSFFRLYERSPWLNFMITSSINPFQLKLLQLPFIYQIVLLVLSWMRPHCTNMGVVTQIYVAVAESF